MDNIIRPTGTHLDIDNKLKMYAQAKAIRNPMESDYRMAAAYCLPRQYNDWTGSEGPPTQQTQAGARRMQYDSTGVNCLPKYVAILNAMLTPQGSRWHKLTADNPDLMKDYSVRDYFDQLNNVLFTYRDDPNARFKQTIGEVYTGLGVYGMGPSSLIWGRSMNGLKSLKYKAWAMKDVYVLVNDEGEVTHIFRRFYMNARQFKLKFPNAEAPRSVRSQLDKPGGPDEGAMDEYIHILCYRDNYDQSSLDVRRHRVCSEYVHVKDKEPIGDEDGYTSMPMNTPRVYTEAGNPYGYSPAMQASAALGGASAAKKTIMKQGHKALDPPLLASDDGVLSGRVDIRPGRVTYGAVNAQGNPLVHALQMGDFQVGEKILLSEQEDIKDAFFVKLFTILEERPQMSATQVVEEVGQKASLLAPTMGRLQSEQGGPQIFRELDILAEQGKLPDQPPLLREAGGEFNIRYTSPMAKALYNEDVSGFMRWVEFSLNYAETAKDASVLDRIDMDNAQPEIADYMNVPTRWVRSPKAAAAVAAKRDQQTQQQQVVEQAPAIASVYNAATKTKGTSNAAGVSN